MTKEEKERLKKEQEKKKEEAKKAEAKKKEQVCMMMASVRVHGPRIVNEPKMRACMSHDLSHQNHGNDVTCPCAISQRLSLCRRIACVGAYMAYSPHPFL